MVKHRRLPKSLHKEFLLLVRCAYQEAVKNSRDVRNFEDLMKALIKRLERNRHQTVPRDSDELYDHIELALTSLGKDGILRLPKHHIPS